jgi:protoporphyrinogen oxidase
LDELVKGIPKDSIYLSSKVTEIDYSKDKTRLVVNGKRVDKLYDYVIVTVPLGHLKAHAKSLFKPRLPQQKLDVIDALGKKKIRQNESF